MLASRDGIDDRERAIFHAANDLSQLDYRAVWVPMQYGTFGTVFGVAGLALMKRRPRLAAGLLLGGTSAYALAKVTKRYVGRGRPANELEDVTIRGKEEGDLGFPSGHAAVSAALTTAAVPFVSAPVRALAACLAAFVSFAARPRGGAPPARRRRRCVPGRRGRFGSEPGARRRRHLPV